MSTWFISGLVILSSFFSLLSSLPPSLASSFPFFLHFMQVLTQLSQADLTLTLKLMMTLNPNPPASTPSAEISDLYGHTQFIWY